MTPSIPHASANTFEEGIICFKPSGWSLATASRSSLRAFGIRLVKNSSLGFLATLGMNQDTSMGIVVADGSNVESCDGVTTRLEKGLVD